MPRATACRTPVGTPELSHYYFPIDSLTEGKVYTYTDTNGSGEPYYWYVQTVTDARDGVPYIVSTRYNAHFQMEQLTKEKSVANGIISVDYRLFSTDSTHQKTIRADIQQNVVFPFQPTTDRTFSYRFKIKFPDFKDSLLTYTVTKDRKFNGYSTFTFRGKTYRTALFDGENLTEVESKDGGNWNVKGYGTEQYAEGLGLVSEDKTIKDTKRSYRLSNIMTMPQFEDLARSAGNRQ